MSQFFKGIALFVAVTCIVWVTVLWRWRATSRDMTITDIVGYLGVLPIVVFALLVGLRWAWRGAAPRREAALQQAAARAAPAAPAATAKAGDEAQRHAVVQLLAAHIGCAAATTPDDLLTAAAENIPRPEFDDALRDGEGRAVMCARMDDLEPELIATQLEAFVVGQRPQRADWSMLEVSEHAQRALGALAEPLRCVAQDLRSWAHLLGVPQRGTAPVQSPPATTPTSPSLVRVLLGWPADWSEFEQAVAADWARQLIIANTEVPGTRFVFAAHAGSGEELWLKADQLLQNLAREGRSDLVLVAACHSDLSDAAVAALEQQQRLFAAPQHPKGVMPGEGAAALLLGGAAWPADPDAYLLPVLLHRPAVARRDKSIEAGTGRVSSQCLQDAATQALMAGGLAAEAVPALVCDGDQHTQRGTEIFGVTLALLPHLDPGEDMRLIGTVTGHTGAVSVLLVIAVAAQRARMNDEPCLALAVGDTFMRLAVLARPGAEPPVAPLAQA